MKLSDTIESVLKSKDKNRVVSIAPDQSVYEAIEKMAEHGIGALLVISNHKTGRHPVGAGLRSQSNPHGSFFKRNPGPPDHDQPSGVREPAAHRGRVHGHHDQTSFSSSSGLAG